MNRRFGYMLPVPTWARFGAIFFSWIHPGGRGELDAHSSYLANIPEKGTVLEVGCGNGDFLTQLKTIGWNVIGTDVDPVAIQIARDRGIDARLGELLNLQLPASSVDAVVLHHVIEHLHNPREMLNECIRIVRPGGKLVIVTPNSRSLGHHLFGPAWYPLDPPRHLILFTLSSLTRLVRESGCKLERAETTARGARSYFHLSLEIVRHHETSPFSRARTLGALAGIAFQFFERFTMLFRKDLGEEALAVAQKMSRS